VKTESIKIENHPPITRLEVFNLSDLVVFAGPNGIGKTRLVSLLLDKFRTPAAIANAQMVIRATSPDETTQWGSDILDLSSPNDAAKLQQTINRRLRRGKAHSKVLNFDAFRSASVTNSFLLLIPRT
jgi:predicted ABC-type ATPase